VSSNPSAARSDTVSIDRVNPTVVSFTTSDSNLSIGETATVTIVFSEKVTDFTNADLDLSAANGSLTPVSTSDGGLTWTAVFTPTNGIVAVGSVITLNSAGVTDLAGNPSSGTTSVTYDIHTIDSSIPTATIVVDDTALNIGDDAVVTITFSEAVSDLDLADLSAGSGVLSNLVNVDGRIWTVDLMPAVGIESTGNVITLDNTGIHDGTGNAGIGATISNSYAVDTKAPTVTITDDEAGISTIAGGTITYTFTFSETVSGFEVGDITVSGGTKGTFTEVTAGTVYTLEVTPASGFEGTLTVDVNAGIATDAAANPNSAAVQNVQTVDTLRPTASIVVADADLTVGETSTVTITFSEAVTGFSNADLDLSLANGTLSPVSSSDGGRTWTATLAPTAGINDATNVITLDNAGITDIAGNAGLGTTTSNNYTIDTIDALGPTVSIVVDDTALNIGETSMVTITFSEEVTGFTVTDLAVGNGTLSGLTTADNITWTAILSPLPNIEDGTNVITLTNGSVTDLASNPNSGTTDSNNYAIDTKAPAVPTVNPLITNVTTPTISGTATVDAGETLTVTVNSVTYSVGDGNLSLSGTDWTLAIPVGNVLGAGTYPVTATVTDAAGNATNDATVNELTIDTIAPTVTITDDEPGVGNIAGGTITYTFSFSEAVTGFDAADITVAGGSKGAFTTLDSSHYTLVVTPAAGVEGTVTVDVSAGVAFDLAGNPNGAAVQSVQSIDTIRPTATISIDDTALKIGDTATVTITFSEAVNITGFTNADLDLSLANGILSPVSTADGGLTWTATFTPTPGIEDPTNIITLKNASVTDLAGNTNSGTTDSNNYAIDTKAPAVPTVNPLTTNDTTPAISGTATVGAGETLTVTVNSVTYTVGDGNLSLAGNVWTLSIPAGNALGEGTYEVIATVADAAGNAASDSSASELVIDITPPAVPTVNSRTTCDTTPVLSGTATVQAGEILTITVSGATYTVIPAAGIWTLDLGTALPSSGTLAPFAVGVHAYDVTATVTDAAGNATSDSTSGELTINTLLGDADDNVLTGTSADETLSGFAGNDTLQGMGGADVLDGGADNDTASYAAASSAISASLTDNAGTIGDAAGDTFTSIENLTGSDYNDTLIGDGGLNTLTGGLGDDILEGMDGIDALVGGGGSDTASYIHANEAILVSLADSSTNAGSDAVGDTYDSIENITGSNFADTLIGNSGANILIGGAGNDTLDGGAGPVGDTLIGGSGIDAASYENAAAGVVASLDTSLAAGQSGDATGDTFTSVESLTGSTHADTLIGNSSVNTLTGGFGDDSLEGRAGADTLAGGNGTDTASYIHAASAISVSLATQSGTLGEAAGDVLSSIENLMGSAYNDTLTGKDGEDNILSGAAGADTLEGGTHAAAGDTASYANAASGVVASLDSTFTPLQTGDAFGDTLTGIENLAGSTHADTLIGDGGANTLSGSLGDDILEGMAGADSLIGGSGTDTASYAHAGSFVVASLSPGFQFGDASGDTFAGIENLAGSDHDDFLTGDDGVNDLIGGLGDDTLKGEAGADTIYANQGHDSAYGGDNNDTFYVSSNPANLPSVIDGGGRDAGDGNVMVLQDLVSGSYNMATLAGVTSNMDTLSIRGDSAATALTISSQDIQNMVNNGAASQLSIKADSGDTLNISLAAGETMTPTVIDAAHTDYTVFNASLTQISQIHWHTA